MKRTIFKQDLAVKLYPGRQTICSAMQLLRKEIRRSPQLQKRLFENNNKHAHYFDHRQLKAILEHFGISEEEFKEL